MSASCSHIPCCLCVFEGSLRAVWGTKTPRISSYRHIAPSHKRFLNTPTTSRTPTPILLRIQDKYENQKGEIHAWSKGTNLPAACFTPLCLIDRNCTHQRKRTLRFNGHKMDISILKRWINTLIRAIFIRHFQWDRHSAQAPNGA